jgi:adenylate cyclase
MSQPLNVLLVQSDAAAAKPLAEFFARRGDKLWQTANLAEAGALLDRHAPGLILLDLHLPEGEWVEFVRRVRRQSPRAGLVVTSKHPDFRRELQAKEQQVHVFLRQPFTREWIEKALKRLSAAEGPAPESTLPRVRVPVRMKITLPYALLALGFALGAAYLVSRYVLESIQERFVGQLADAAKLSADWMVQEENRRLETLRLLTNLEGMAGAVQSGNAEAVRALALPVAVSQREEAVEILDPRGQSVLSLRREPQAGPEAFTAARGENIFAGWEFVRRALNARVDQQGDKYAGLARAPWGDMFYVAGPVFNDSGQPGGAILVGKSASSLAREIRQDTLAHVTLYTLEGEALASTLFVDEAGRALTPEQTAQVLQGQDAASLILDRSAAGAPYSEILGPWEVRNGEDLGVMGTALAQTALSRPTQATQLQVFLVVAITFLFVVALGLYIADQITRPLSRIVRASQEVARGNFEVKVEARGDDETAVLAHSFNYMVSGLQEGFIYRDLLGRTVSPEVREELREVFASGNLRLEGQAAIATVLMSDIRGFTTLSEKAEPSAILNWLNEYFGELVPVITAQGGVVDKFEGDAILAFFGILPRPLPAEESAYQACRAAVEMLRVVQRLNRRRAARGEPPLVTGIGLNTGAVTAGGLGTADRLNYTIIGDAVNTTQRLEGFTREFGESGALISQSTYEALGERAAEFRLEPLGAHTFKGKSEAVAIYRLWASRRGGAPDSVREGHAQPAAPEGKG